MFYFNRIIALCFARHMKLFLKCPKEKAVLKEEIEIFERFFPLYFPFFFPRQIFSKINLILKSTAVVMGSHFPEENVSFQRFLSARFLMLTFSSLRNFPWDLGHRNAFISISIAWMECNLRKEGQRNFLALQHLPLYGI